MDVLIYQLILIILYTYFGYFFAVLFLGKIIRKKVVKADIEPHVTMLIAAYNEEKGISEKIEETLKLDYPRDKFRIIVVSDASSDRTDEIVRSYSHLGVELFRVEGRVGKTEARNVVMKAIEADIVVFSDATTVYNTDILRKFVRNFAHPSVGMVTGHLIYKSSKDSQTSLGQILFWKYESMIKKAQTSMGTLTGSVGCATAFRHSLYEPLPSNIIEDFTEPLMFVLKGYRVVYDEEAICYEETTQKCSNEWQMRVRVIRGGMKGMLHAKKILNPLIYPVPFFQLLSHKILRWLVPVFMISLFILNIALLISNPHSVFGAVLMTLQLGFYATALFSYLLSKIGIHSKLASVPLYFIILNSASLVAIFRTLTSDLEATWETQREG